MRRALLIAVRFHDGRFHGDPEWPPSPSRLFQALVAGCARGSDLPDRARAALQWLEQLEPAVIAAPPARAGRSVKHYVPNNDLDAVGGDPSRVGTLRTEKVVRPHFFDEQQALLYLWHFEDSATIEGHAREICHVAKTVYQVGRGLDMAWACADAIDEAKAMRSLENYPGLIYYPSSSGSGGALPCPQPGSLDSLMARHAAQRTRFRPDSGAGALVFAQPPRPRFRQVAYSSPNTTFVYELGGKVWPLHRCAELVESAKQAAATRLTKALPASAGQIDRLLCGRGASEADKAARVRVVALPSIGHAHADQQVRRLLVSVPPDCPIDRGSIDWAFSGLPLQVDDETGEILLGLVASGADDMAGHYGVGGTTSRRWSSVTPVALPWSAGAARGTPDQVAAVRQALRHAGLPSDATVVRIQREPFHVNGQRAEAFRYGERFHARRLWHVEVEFSEAPIGPILIGDGRYLGLGLMHPLADAGLVDGMHCLAVASGLATAADPTECARALRRAVMARAQHQLGRGGSLPTFMTGHKIDGSPSDDPEHGHLAFAMDPRAMRLLVIAPHRLQRRHPRASERAPLDLLARALQGLTELRAGASGLLKLETTSIEAEADPLTRSAQVWVSATDYAPTRHARRMAPPEMIEQDIRAEIARSRLPAPHRVELQQVREGPRGGLTARIALHFGVAISGPLLLGRTKHLGGGLFTACAEVLGGAGRRHSAPPTLPASSA